MQVRAARLFGQLRLSRGRWCTNMCVVLGGGGRGEGQGGRGQVCVW
jgi:hypothetical protein